MTAPKPRESDILAQCLEYLELRRIFAWRNNCGAVKIDGRHVRFNGMRGSSDIIGVLPDGRFLAVETKRPGGKLSAEQDAFLAAIERYGGVALVVKSVKELEADLREVMS